MSEFTTTPGSAATPDPATVLRSHENTMGQSFDQNAHETVSENRTTQVNYSASEASVYASVPANDINLPNNELDFYDAAAKEPERFNQPTPSLDMEPAGMPAPDLRPTSRAEPGVNSAMVEAAVNPPANELGHYSEQAIASREAYEARQTMEERLSTSESFNIHTVV